MVDITFNCLTLGLMLTLETGGLWPRARMENLWSLSTRRDWLIDSNVTKAMPATIIYAPYEG
jgi:hypothetical protein